MLDDPMVEKIGQGGQGHCFLLKKYKPPYVMKLNQWNAQEELKALKKLAHGNIVSYLDPPPDYEYNIQEGFFPIFMEYCEEGDLRHVICDKTLIYSVATIVKWANEIFTALIYIKTKKIAHRDVKPQNIFVDEQFTLKLGDFGIITQESERINGIPGTALYQPPDFKEKNDLSIEDLYRGDVFAAGLTIFQLMERIASFNSLLFTPTQSGDVEKLQDLIRCCSCPTIPVEDRKNAESVLVEMKALEELFKKSIVLPERKRHQIHLSKPIEPLGLFYDSFTAPGVIFTSQSDFEAISEDGTTQNIHNSQLFLDGLLPKAQSLTQFVNLTRERLRFKHNKDDVNKARAELCEKFTSLLKLDSLKKNEKEVLVKEIQSFEIDFSVKFHYDIPPDHFSGEQFDFENIEIVDDPENRLPEPLSSFRELLCFDYILQDRCIPFAIHTLWNCNSLSLSWVELADLLNTSIHNIEQLEKVFSRRKLFFFRYLGESRNQWCRGYDLVFKKDLSDFRVYSKWSKRTFRAAFLGETPIDLELIRRALLKRIGLVEEYAGYEKKSREDVSKELDLFFHRYNMLRLNRLGPISCLPNDFVGLLPTSAKELVERTFEAEETKFKGYIYLLDSIPESIVRSSCSCEKPCETRVFPVVSERFLKPEDLQIEYSTCLHQNHLQFLETHLLFERAFRLLNDWYDVKLHQVTHFYLLEKIIHEIEEKKDPSFGFHFILMKEKSWPGNGKQTGNKRFICHTEEKQGEPAERTGLLVALQEPQPNAFWNKDFRFETISDLCLLEYLGLVYISLFEMQKFLKVMFQYLTGSGKGSNEDASDKQREKYRRTMKEGFEKFWNKKKVFT